VGWAMISASATALALQRLSTSPMPFTWIIPATALVSGLLLVVRGHEQR
jgi:hypothetical protein